MAEPGSGGPQGEEIARTETEGEPRFDFSALRKLLDEELAREWTPERADRVFRRIMAAIERRRRRRRWALVGAWLAVPAAVLLLVQRARR